MTKLTKDQIAARGELATRFRIAIYETIWAEIENSSPDLLCDDNGRPYGATRKLGGISSLEEMADLATNAAAEILKRWL